MPDEITRTVPTAVWNFVARPVSLRAAAGDWERMAVSLRSRADNLVSRGDTLLGSDWAGDTRDSYEGFHKRLVSSLDEAAELAETYETRLRDLADYAESTQEALANNFDLIADLPASFEDAAGQYTFTFGSDVADAFEALVSEARTLNQEFFSAQNALHDGLTDRWLDLAADWEGVGLGTADPFVLPESPPGTRVLVVDGEVIINTGPGDDQVQVTQDGDRILVTINGVTYSYPAFTEVTIRGDRGDDTIEVTGDPAATVTVLGSRGDDLVTAGGYAPVVIGGKGDDVLLGSSGADYLSGGSGDDYLEGREGNDVILSGSGGDTIYAGDGYDTISNPEGSSYIDAGPGHNNVYSGKSEDPFSELEDTFVATDFPADVLGDGFVTPYGPDDYDLSFLNIEGSPEFVARVEADIKTLSRYMGDVLYGIQETPLDDATSVLSGLASSQNGDWRWGEHTITIKEAPPDAGYTAQRETSSSFWGGNRDTVIHYNPVHNGAHQVTPAEGYQDAEYGSPIFDLLRELEAESEAWAD